MLVASFLGASSFRLLSEPKDARLGAPRLSVTEHPDGVRLRSDRPVIDLWLWDPDGGLELLDNFVTLMGPGEVVLRARGRHQRLLARSLAGRHVIE